MKSLAELQAIKDKMKNKVARPVLNALVEQVNNDGLSDKVTVTQTGCVGLCQLEPIVEVYEAGKEKITYVKMTPEKVKAVVEKHLKGGNVVAEYTVASVK